MIDVSSPVKRPKELILPKPSGITSIEAGDFANEAGKSYMKGLWEAVESHKHIGSHTLWFAVKIKKDILNPAIVRITIGAMSKPFRYLHENLDLWKYDYISDKLELEWSLPHRTEMKNFLRAPDKYNKDLIGWIKTYEKQAKINLEDDTAVKYGS